MAATIGNLVAKISVNTKELTEGLKASERELQRSIKKMEKETGVSIDTMRTELGSTASDKLEANRRAARSYMGPQAETDMPDIKTLTRADVKNVFAQPEKGLLSMVKSAGKVALAINALDIATDIWNGDITVAADKIKELPFGIGRTARALESVIGKWSGLTAEIDKYKKQAEEIDAQSKKRLELSKKTVAAEKELNDLRQEASKAGQLAQLEGADRERLAIQFKMQEDLARIDESVSAFGKDTLFADSASKARAMARVEKQAADARASVKLRATRELAAIDRREYARAAEERQQFEAKQKAAAEQAAKDAKRLADEKKEHERRMNDISLDIAAKALQIQGKTAEAERLKIRATYEQRIKDAEELGDKEMIARLKLARDLELSTAREMGTGRAEVIDAKRTFFGAFNSDVSSGGLSGGTENRYIGIGGAGKQIISDPKQQELLQQILNTLRAGPVGRAA